jgi:CO dehydrogenase/acetyl-CoA synthase beta subunit
MKSESHRGDEKSHQFCDEADHPIRDPLREEEDDEEEDEDDAEEKRASKVDMDEAVESADSLCLIKPLLRAAV